MIDTITQLKINVEHLEDRLDGFQEEIDHIMQFLQSSKFREDPTVQVGDVINMLRSVLSNDLDRFCEPWGAACDISRERTYRLAPQWVRYDHWKWE